MSHYGKYEYWEDRYQRLLHLIIIREPEQFDWYLKYKGLRDCLTPHIKSFHKILNVGCGNSSNKQINYGRIVRGYV